MVRYATMTNSEHIYIFGSMKERREWIALDPVRRYALRAGAACVRRMNRSWSIADTAVFTSACAKMDYYRVAGR